MIMRNLYQLSIFFSSLMLHKYLADMSYRVLKWFILSVTPVDLYLLVSERVGCNIALTIWSGNQSESQSVGVR